MKARGLINWCIMLLWFVATYHCAFEQLISRHNNHSFSSQTATTSSESSRPSQCPSHHSDDASSHSEGKSCGNVIQPSLSNELRDVIQIVLIPTVSSFLAILNNNFIYTSAVNSFLVAFTSSFDTASSKTLLRHAHSLSIVPNAPPVTFA